MLAAYAFAIALSAVLLFTLEPCVAKLALPLLGGSPAVWNTSLVFFQAALLAGYAWAALLARQSSHARQVALHGALLALALLSLPVALRGGAPAGGAWPV